MWRRLPVVECKGFCAGSCGPWSATTEEVGLIEEALGGPIPKPTGTTCPLLVNGRCSVYRVRPTICRAWGGVEQMECPHGCRVVGFMSHNAFARILMSGEFTSPWHGWEKCVQCGGNIEAEMREKDALHCVACMKDFLLRQQAGQNAFVATAVYDPHQDALGAYRDMQR